MSVVHAQLAEASEWASQNAGLLANCFGRFAVEGTWPELEELQYDFELSGITDDVATLAWNMPKPMGYVEQQRLVLLVRGLSHVPAATALLLDWCRVLGFAYQLWLGDRKAKLTREQVRHLLDGDDGRARMVSIILLRESWPLGSGSGGADDEWVRDIHSGIRAARDATSPEDVLAARAAVLYPAPAPAPAPTVHADVRGSASSAERPAARIRAMPRMPAAGRGSDRDDIRTRLVLDDSGQARDRPRIAVTLESHEPRTPVERHDVFIAHAGEDKDAIARPLATRLRELGYRVWFDEFELKLGMSLRRSIDRGLAGSRYGAVILSHPFFDKEWPQRELDGLTAQETTTGQSRILPIWHGIDHVVVARYSPTLADRYAASTADGVDSVVAIVAEVIGEPGAAPDHAGPTRPGGAFGLSPVPESVRLEPMLTGSQIIGLVDGAYEAVFDVDAGLGDATRLGAAEFFDGVRDWREVLADMSVVDREQLRADLAADLRDLLDDGVVVLGGRYLRELRSSFGTDPWPGVVLRAAPIGEGRRTRPDPSSEISGPDAAALVLAQVLHDKGDHEAAAERLRPIAERGNVNASLLLGMTLRDLGRLEEAAGMLSRAADAGRSEALTPLGLVLHELGRLDEAEAVLTKAIEILVVTQDATRGASKPPH